VTGIQPRTLARREQLRQRIAAFIGGTPGCDGNQIQAHLGGNRSILLAAVRDLIDRGDVTRWRDPAERRTCRYTLAADYKPEPAPPPPPPAQPRTCEAGCGRQLPARKHSFCSDACRIRQRKKERVIENGDYAAGLVRQIRVMGTRASGDLDALAWLAEMALQARQALALAVDGCRARGYSDAEIGQALGITRQAVGQRFGRKRELYTGLAGTGDPA